MGSILTIIGALLPFVLSELQQFKTISPQLAALIEGIEGAGASLITNISATPAGSSASVTTLSILSAIQAAISVLQSQTTVSPKSLAIIAAFDAAVAAGVAASNITSVVPTNLQPITPLAAF